MKVKFLIGIVAAGLLAGNPAFSGEIARPAPADPLLQGAPAGPCADAMAVPDYVPGADASGNPVPRADLGAEKVPVPGDLNIPLANRGQGRRGAGSAPAYVTVDGRKLDRLLNPPACAPQGH